MQNNSVALFDSQSLPMM